ncbi:MAG TPA: chemotaxis protein CheB [Burkholderiales bacterium]|nr:chemotaxis protein CheB [Burkholderiales bacterium]
MRFIGIGTSLGGTQALKIMLPLLPPAFPAAIALVFHRASETSIVLPRFLQQHCRMPVEEAQDKTLIRPGRLYFAPADYHLLVEGSHFALTTEAEVSHARPSIDVLFESAAEVYGKDMTGIVLTGAGQDGARGCIAIKCGGGLTIIQNPETAECSSMPKAVLASHAADIVLDLKNIVPFLLELQNSKGDAK